MLRYVLYTHLSFSSPSSSTSSLQIEPVEDSELGTEPCATAQTCQVNGHAASARSERRTPILGGVGHS